MLGIGAIIGTGIFVLTAVAANKAGPGMMYSFVIAGFVCALTALIYSEIAAMVPVSGSAYTYSYAVLGETIAWMVGWALILEYAVAAGAVSVGWSGYINGLLHDMNMGLPAALMAGPADTITLPDGTTTTWHLQPTGLHHLRCWSPGCWCWAPPNRQVHFDAGGDQGRRTGRIHRAGLATQSSQQLRTDAS